MLSGEPWQASTLDLREGAPRHRGPGGVRFQSRRTDTVAVYRDAQAFSSHQTPTGG